MSELKNLALGSVDEKFNEEFPNFSNLHMKSKKWGGEYINAEITVKTDGTLSVKYSPDSFEKYMAGGES